VRTISRIPYFQNLLQASQTCLIPHHLKDQGVIGDVDQHWAEHLHQFEGFRSVALGRAETFTNISSRSTEGSW